MKYWINAIATLVIAFWVLGCDSEEVTLVETITLNKSEMSLVVDDEESLSAKVLPSNANYECVTWTSSVPEVASVSNSGTVKALSVGNTEISASAGGVTAICRVSVSARIIPVTSIQVNPSAIDMFVGEDKSLVATIVPDDATETHVFWASSDVAVATITQEGSVHAVKEGKAIITATADGQKATCIITVDYYHVTQIVLSPSATSFYPGESATIQATVIPSNATYPELTWGSSDDRIANVNSGRVSAISSGTVIITAINKDIEESVVFTILIPVSSVALENTSAFLLVGESLALKAIINPADANLKDSLKWTSSDEDVATVTAEGIVTAHKPGNTIITVNADGKTATCSVSVTLSGSGNEGTDEEIWK